MRKLIRERIVARLDTGWLREMHDAARLPPVEGPLAFTTDSFVVSPLFFPGGDIGSLAVYGTVNDLAVSGAEPLYLTLSVIIEEGLPFAMLDRALDSVARAANRVGIPIVAGDTKVVPRGAADGLFLNTAGIGRVIEPGPAGPGSIAPDDVLLVTGPIGRHGMAVLSAREGLALEPSPTSDSAPLADAAKALRDRIGTGVRAMRDATRGGVTAVLHEWAEASGLTLSIDECDVPVSPVVRGACELLGIDPLHVANEGTMVVAVAAESAAGALDTLRGIPETAGAAIMGRAVRRRGAAVTIRRALGREQPLDEPAGAPLPRIC